MGKKGAVKSAKKVSKGTEEVKNLYSLPEESKIPEG